MRHYIEKEIKPFVHKMVEVGELRVSEATGIQLRSIENNMNNLIEPEIKELLMKENDLIDKYFTIPDNVPLSEVDIYRNNYGIDDYEKKKNDQLNELKTVAIQQMVMIKRLQEEISMYQRLSSSKSDAKLIDEIENKRNDPNYADLTLADIIDLTMKDFDDADETLTRLNMINLSNGDDEDQTLVNDVKVSNNGVIVIDDD